MKYTLISYDDGKEIGREEISEAQAELLRHAGVPEEWVHDGSAFGIPGGAEIYKGGGDNV